MIVISFLIKAPTDNKSLTAVRFHVFLQKCQPVEYPLMTMSSHDSEGPPKSCIHTQMTRPMPRHQP